MDGRMDGWMDGRIDSVAKIRNDSWGADRSARRLTSPPIIFILVLIVSSIT
jgi:hypothetical protein